MKTGNFERRKEKNKKSIDEFQAQANETASVTPSITPIYGVFIKDLRDLYLSHGTMNALGWKYCSIWSRRAETNGARFCSNNSRLCGAAWLRNCSATIVGGGRGARGASTFQGHAWHNPRGERRSAGNSNGEIAEKTKNGNNAVRARTRSYLVHLFLSLFYFIAKGM